MKKNKILFMIFFTFLLLLISFGEVKADYCTDCAEKGTPCGYCGYSCAINDEGKCTINAHDQELWDQCAKNAKTEDQCNKCGSYVWDTSSSSCVSKNMNEEDSDNEYILNSKKTSCGNITGIPRKLPELTSYIVTIIHIAIPVILVIMGSIDLFKGITAQKEDEIKKGQQMFIKRLVIAAIIFFIFILVKLVISLVVDEKDEENMLGCMKCFMYNECN